VKNSSVGHGIFRLDDINPDIGNRLRIYRTGNGEIATDIIFPTEIASPNIVSPPHNSDTWVHVAVTFKNEERKLSLFFDGKYI
jgi:hypothetical protein